MITEKEIKEAEKMIQEAIPNKNKYEKPLWQAVLDIIAKSDYGKQSAEVEMVSPLPPGSNQIQEMMDGGSFDGVIMHFFGLLNALFDGLGNVSVEPYSKGLGTRSAKYKFERR